MTVTLTATDAASGVAKTQYRLAGASDWTDAIANQSQVAAPSDHSNDGAHAYEYRAIDNVGNVSDIGSCTVRIATVKPTVSDNAPTGWSKTAVTVTLTPVDTSGFGIQKTIPQERLVHLDRHDGQHVRRQCPGRPLQRRRDVYQYQAIDNNGLASDTGSRTVRIDTTGPTVTDNAPTSWTTAP